MNDKKERRKSASSSSGAQLAAARRIRETPYQDICRIRRTILALRDAKGSLSSDDYFVDPSFAPDMTSLAYVYSGDDKYERTIFQRPHETQDDPVFVGVGGVCDEPFPWRQWKLRHWFHAALVTVSLSLKHLEKIIPGYKNFEQGFSKDYTGAFHFNIWRFGEWVDIVVDDRMPMLDGRHLFCGPMGSAQELWGPLVEKAYAKCKKTFQSIEYGHTLDALTDLTGAVCEHFSPDVRPPSNLFRILLKSHLARSMMVCWRNDKRLTPTGFTVDSELQENQNLRYLHVITAVTKFPTTDGRLVEMIRLKCPFPGEARWQGKFSDRDSASWDSVNRDFMDRLQPLTKKDDDEYWVSMEDFRCNFGGLFVVSSPEPFRVDGLSLARSYHLPPALECWEPNSGLASPDLASINGLQRRGSAPKPDDTVGRLLDSDTLSLARRRASHASMVPLRHDERHAHSKRGSEHKQGHLFFPFRDYQLFGCRSSEVPSTPPGVDQDGSEKQSSTSSPPPMSPSSPASLVSSDLDERTAFGDAGIRNGIHTSSVSRSTGRKSCDLQRRAMAQSEANRLSGKLVTAAVVQPEGSKSKVLADKRSRQTSDGKHPAMMTSPDGSPASEGNAPLAKTYVTTAPKTPRSPYIVPLRGVTGDGQTSPPAEDSWPPTSQFTSPNVSKSESNRAAHAGARNLTSADSAKESRVLSVGLNHGYTRSPSLSNESGQSDDHVLSVDPQQEGHISPSLLMDPVKSPKSPNVSAAKGVSVENQPHLSGTLPKSPMAASARHTKVTKSGTLHDKEKPGSLGTHFIELPQKSSNKFAPEVTRPPISTAWMGDQEETEVKTPSSSRSKGSSASSPTGSFPRSAHSLAHSESSASATTSPSIKTTSVFTFPAATEFTSGTHHPHQHRSGTASASACATPHSAKCKPRTPTKKSRGSISNQSDSGSAHSSSEISLQFKPTMHAANLGGGSAAGGSGGGGGDGASASGCFGRVLASEDRRPHSAPQTNLARHFSSNSLSSLTQGHFRATKADYFRSEGRWRLMLEVYDKWTRSKPSSSRANLDFHSRSQRHHFQVTRLEGPDELSPPTLQGKRHVIVSLVQDYRHGAVTANSLLVPIGFCLYRSKGTEKDDKRHISKFQLLDQIQGEPEMREVNARFDLEPGSYFLVPFYNSDSHEGEYLLRILTEESLHIKTGCRVS